MAKKSKDTAFLIRRKIKRPGRHSKKHKGPKKSERGQGYPQ